jgi:hypothetical protein
MNSNQDKSLTSFVPATASPAAAASPTPKAGVLDDRLVTEIATEISPKADKPRQTPPTQPHGDVETSQEADKPRQTPPSEIAVAEVEPLEAEKEGVIASPIFRRADDRLVAEIAAGTSLAEAARRAGVSDRTAQRRWADPNFRKKVLNARCQIRWEVVGRLTTEMKKATATLMAGMSAKSESVRVSAARSILKIGHEMAGQQEENAMLAEKLDDAKDAFARSAGEQEN